MNKAFLLMFIFSLTGCTNNKVNIRRNKSEIIDSTIVVCDNFRGYKKISYNNFVVFNSLIDFSKSEGVFVYNLKDSLIPIEIKIEDRRNCLEEPTICTDIEPIMVKDGVVIKCNPIIYKPLSGKLKIIKKHNLIKMILEEVIWFNNIDEIETQIDTLIFKL